MKRTLLTILQISVTLGLLWYIFRDSEKNARMAEALSSADWPLLLPGIACVGLACILQTERWRQLLAAQDIRMGWWRTFRVYMIGLFFNMFLLGATGGDVVKIYYAMREAMAKKAAALLSVLVDRMMGLLGLMIVTVGVVALRWESLTAHALTRGLLGTLVMVMGAMGGLVVVGFLIDRFGLSEKIPSWVPLHGKLVEITTAFSTYARDGRTLLSTLGLSITSHFLNFLAFYFAALALGVFRGLSGALDIASVMPVIMTITALPISLSGVGVRETLFEQMLSTLFGTPEETAVIISVLGFMMMVFWGLVGGIIYLCYRPTGGLHLAEVREDVAEVEAEVEGELPEIRVSPQSDATTGSGPPSPGPPAP
jgi:glycosyltransferase 2 family protein